MNDISELDSEFSKLIEKRCSHSDIEVAHNTADDILCDLLTRLGLTNTVEAFKAVQKWYA